MRIRPHGWKTRLAAPARIGLLRRAWKLLSHTRTTNVALVFLTAAMALTTYWQWGSMENALVLSEKQWRSELEVLQQQLNQADAVLAQMANEQAIMLRQTEQTDQMLGQMRTDSETMKQQTVQTESVIEQMRIEQRAWLGVGSPTIELTPDKPINFAVVIENYGNTPATVTAYYSDAFPSNNDANLSLVFAAVGALAGTSNRQSVIAPDSTHRYPTVGRQLTQAEIDQVMAKTRALFVIGLLVYTDVRGERRTTQFCFQYDADAKELRAAHQFNFMS